MACVPYMLHVHVLLMCFIDVQASSKAIQGKLCVMQHKQLFTAMVTYPTILQPVMHLEHSHSCSHKASFARIPQNHVHHLASAPAAVS